MEFKGTKGKWVTEVNDHDPFYRRPVIEVGLKGHYPVSVVYGDGNDFDQESKANALLISKAPEILEMLIDIVEKQYNSKYTLADLNGAISNARELIKSATETK